MKGPTTGGDVVVRLTNATVEIPLRGFRKSGRKPDDPRIFLDDSGNWKLLALDQISLEVRRGDRIGVVGSNGSGKTTLLRLIGGLMPLASGALEIYGEVRVLLNIGAGLSLALTGRQNAELQFGLLGIETMQRNQFLENVQDFSELGEFYDMPVGAYSPGMISRLQFAINTVEPADILLLDEWIGVADEKFYRKAQERLHHFIDRNEVFICASHNRILLDQMTSKRVEVRSGKLERCL